MGIAKRTSVLVYFRALAKAGILYAYCNVGLQRFIGICLSGCLPHGPPETAHKVDSGTRHTRFGSGGGPAGTCKDVCTQLRNQACKDMGVIIPHCRLQMHGKRAIYDAVRAYEQT